MRRLAWVGFASVLLSAPLARAAGADDKAAAQAMFDEGRKLMEQGKYAAACPKLEASQRLDPGAGTLLNLAACYDKNGQTASAWVTYTDAATASRDRHPDWAQRAEARAAALKPTLSHLTIEAPSSASVTRDGKQLDAGSFGAAMPVDPGHHVIDATAPNKKPFHQEIDVGAKGADAHVTVTLEDAPVAQPTTTTTTTTTVNPITAPPPKTEQTSSGSGVRIAGITMIGVGVAGVIVGGIFGGLAIGKKNDAAPLCTSDFSRCTTAGKASVDDALAFGNVSTVAFIAGGVLAAAGVVVFVLAPKKKESAVSFSVSPFGVSMGGSF